MRRPELGSIVQGMQLDLSLFQLNELHFSGNGDSMGSLAIYTAHHPDRLRVSGKCVVQDGLIPGLVQQFMGQLHKLTVHLRETLTKLVTSE